MNNVRTLTIPTHSVRQRWNVRKIETTWKRRQDGETTLEIANDIGCSPDALRQAWRQMGYFLQEPKLDLEPYEGLIVQYNMGHSLRSLCIQNNVDYARIYSAMKWRGLIRPQKGRWSRAEIERMLHLEAEGFTPEEIGQDIDRSSNAVRNQLSRQYNEGDRRVRWPAHRLAKARRYLRQGLSKTEVAIKLGTTSSALSNALLRNGYKKTKRQWSNDELQKLRERLNSGETMDDVAFSVGIQGNSLYCLLRRRGV